MTRVHLRATLVLTNASLAVRNLAIAHLVARHQGVFRMAQIAAPHAQRLVLQRGIPTIHVIQVSSHAEATSVTSLFQKKYATEEWLSIRHATTVL